MSIIFGMKRDERGTVSERELGTLARATDRWAPDGTFLRSANRIGMGFQPYHTHQRSHLESLPSVDEVGNMVALDGRLDNHQELSEQLAIREQDISDSLIVLTALRCWGEDCFSKLIGDWALAIWSQQEHSLYLARDHAGTRTLYFEETDEVLLWATFLEAFFVGTRSRELNETYAARYLGCRPIGCLTPYKSILAVPPAHYIKFQDGKRPVRRAHWSWFRTSQIRYPDEIEYEKHFLSLFRKSVERRTGQGAPLMSQLSGGMDSTAIVCMSDRTRLQDGVSSDQLLDTMSYFDDSEPGWNEKPYFSLVESRRGKTGLHIAASFTDRRFRAPDSSYGTQLLPGADQTHAERDRVLAEYADARGIRALLSGVGGDDLLGGIPTPYPELADYFTRLRISSFLKQGIAWGLAQRTCLPHLTWNTIALLWSLYAMQQHSSVTLPTWLGRGAHGALGRIDDTEPFRHSVWVRPSAVLNGWAWWSILEALPHTGPTLITRYEYRYPYLDRELVEFLFSIPRQQLVRPGRRRYLMRRALVGIVPNEILERRRKAYCARTPIALLQVRHDRIAEIMNGSVAAQRGLVDEKQFLNALQEALKGTDSGLPFPILRTVSFELWLRSMGGRLA